MQRIASRVVLVVRSFAYGEDQWPVWTRVRVGALVAVGADWLWVACRSLLVEWPACLLIGVLGTGHDVVRRWFVHVDACRAA